MNTPNRPHEELDADERELARVVRALPGSEPPPALDLRILKAAQDAVATPGKRARRVFWATNSAGSLWGLGTAAAAVLAVGISWQLFMRAPSSNLPARGPAVIAKDDAQDRDSTSVDFVSAAPEAAKGTADQVASTAAPPSSPMREEQRAAATAAEPMRQESKPIPPTGPQPFLDEHVAAANEARARDQNQIATSEQYSSDLRADAAAKSAVAQNAPAENAANAGGAPALATAAAPAVAPAAPPPPMETERLEQSAPAQPALARTTAETGMLAGAAAPVGQAEKQSKPADSESFDDARHRVRLDARLYPESWILKIRSRLKHGDVIGARASLKLFVEKYPQETVPDNLKPLLGE